MIESFLATMIVAATPLIFAACGGVIAERSGVLNLGVEGMMLLGAVSAFATAYTTGSTALGIAAGAAGGAAGALLFTLVALGFAANQAATGLALAIFGAGISGLVGQGFVGEPIVPLAKVTPPVFAETTLLGRLLFGQDAMVYGAFGLAIVLSLLLWRSRAGLILRAVGDDDRSANALGLNVLRIRALAVVFGGACAGLGGAYLSLAYAPLWGENMTAGRGWIALALIVFAGWSPVRVIFGALIFAAFEAAQFFNESIGLTVPSQVLSMAPYLATIIALVVIAKAGQRGEAPARLGRTFLPER